MSQTYASLNLMQHKANTDLKPGSIPIVTQDIQNKLIVRKHANIRVIFWATSKEYTES